MLLETGAEQEPRDSARIPHSKPRPPPGSRTCNCCGLTSRAPGSQTGRAPPPRWQRAGHATVNRLGSVSSGSVSRLCSAMDRPGFTASLVVRAGRRRGLVGLRESVRASVPLGWLLGCLRVAPAPRCGVPRSPPGLALGRVNFCRDRSGGGWGYLIRCLPRVRSLKGLWN